MADKALRQVEQMMMSGAWESLILPYHESLTINYQPICLMWWEKTNLAGYYDAKLSAFGMPYPDDQSLYRSFSFGHEMGNIFIGVYDDALGICSEYYPYNPWPFIPGQWNHWAIFLDRVSWPNPNAIRYVLFRNGECVLDHNMGDFPVPFGPEIGDITLPQVADGNIDEIVYLLGQNTDVTFVQKFYEIGLYRKLQLTDFDSQSVDFWNGWYSNVDALSDGQVPGFLIEHHPGEGGFFTTATPWPAVLNNGGCEYSLTDGGIIDRVLTNPGPSPFRIRSPFKSQWTGNIFRQGA